MVIVRNGLGESASGWQDLRVGGMEEDNEAESTNQPDAARILWQGGEPCGEPLQIGMVWANPPAGGKICALGAWKKIMKQNQLTSQMRPGFSGKAENHAVNLCRSEWSGRIRQRVARFARWGHGRR